MKCIIGLGNPGKKYEKTRHNIGFMALDEIAKQHAIQFDKTKFKCEYYIGLIQNQKVLLIKPQTFMNLSGEGVRPLLDYYNVDYENALVIYDDLDLPTGKIRLREKGGHGGHNGIRSLIEHLGTKEFKRLRIGIGRPVDATPIVNYVLKPFPKNEEPDVATAIDTSVKACDMWMNQSFNEVMNVYNK